MNQSTFETKVHHQAHEGRLLTYHKQSGYIGNLKLLIWGNSNGDLVLANNCFSINL